MEIAHVVKYLHYISIFIVFSCLATQFILVKPKMEREILKIAYKVDGYYGLFSILTVGAGLTLWLWIGKPSEFYHDNGIIYFKLVLFVAVGLLSIVPTIFFSKNRKGDDSDTIEVPVKIRSIIKLELLILLVIPFLAILMTNGVSIF